MRLTSKGTHVYIVNYVCEDSSALLTSTAITFKVVVTR